MTDNQAVAENVDEKVTSQDNSPQSEEPKAEVQTTQPEETIEPKAEEVPEDLPQETDEQRKAFQKMRQELKAEKEARLKAESAFDAFRPKQNYQPQGVDINQYTDSLTGEVNWNNYNLANQQYTQQLAATQAQSAAQEAIDENNARTKYPEAFSSQEVEQEVADLWFAAKMRGNNPSITDIAGKVAKRYQKAVTQAEKQGRVAALEQVTPKEQAALEAQGQNSGAQAEKSFEEDQTLLNKARYGDDDALAKLIGGVAWKGK